MQCKRKSKDFENNGLCCSREAIDESGYCIFHKPNKTLEEKTIFWKLINWDHYGSFSNQKDIKLFLSSKVKINIEKKKVLDKQYRQSMDKNFTEEEKLLENFNEIIGLYKSGNIREVDSHKVNFRGFIFPDNVNEFKYHYTNISTSGYGTMDFSEATFEGRIKFDEYFFRYKTIFESTKFGKQFSFKKAIFENNLIFKNVKTEKLTEEDLEGIFFGTKFNGNFALFENANNIPIVQESFFSQHTRLTLRDITFSRQYFEHGENTYRLAKSQAMNSGYYERAGEYYYQERCYKGYQILPPFKLILKDENGLKKFYFWRYRKRVLKKFLDYMFKITIGYGENPKNAILVSILTIIIFSLIYYLIYKHGAYNVFLGNYSDNYFDWLYFSIITFTTLGYGDITPNNIWLKQICGLESFLGFVLTSLFILTISKKYSR